MTYEKLKEMLNGLTDSQLKDTVSIAIIDSMGFEMIGVSDFVNPKSLTSENDQDYREAVFLDDIDDSILHKDHVYLTVLI